MLSGILNTSHFVIVTTQVRNFNQILSHLLIHSIVIIVDFFSWLAGMPNKCLLKVHFCVENVVFLMGRTENSFLFHLGTIENAQKGTPRQHTVSLIMLALAGDGSFCSFRKVFAFSGFHFAMKVL